MRLRRFAFAAFALDALLGAGALLISGPVVEAAPAPPTAEFRYVRSAEGCAQLRRVADTVWRYEGVVDDASCTVTVEVTIP
jgi:hypothetical protein